MYSINKDGTKKLHPLVYALAQGEIEMAALIAMHHMKETCMQLFGLTPRFKGGLNSDHTECSSMPSKRHFVAMFPTHYLKVPYQWCQGGQWCILPLSFRSESCGVYIA